MLEFGQRSTLTVPFFLDGRTMGMIELVETAYERRFTEAEIELARSLGEQAAVAIANAKLFQREELRNRRLEDLLDASRSVAASLKLQTVLERLSAEIADLLGGEGVAVEVRLRGDDGAYVPFDILLGEASAGGGAGESRRWPGGGARSPPSRHQGAMRRGLPGGAARAQGRC
jgi:GAF domain-containing protein